MNIKFQKWDKSIDGEIGTLRSVPENYYVATILDNHELIFEGIEGQTKDLPDEEKLRIRECFRAKHPIVQKESLRIIRDDPEEK